MKVQFPRTSSLHAWSVLLLVFSVVFFTACDTTSAEEPSADTTIEGRTTSDSGYSSESASSSDATPSSQESGVSGAAVTATSVAASGDVAPLNGETETDAEGSFALDVTDASDVMIVTATSSDYEGSALVRFTGSPSVQAMPITSETTVESEVYAEAKAIDDGEVTLADVAYYVDQEVAADVQAGNSTVADVAVYVRDAVHAEAESRNENDESPAEDDAQNHKDDAFLGLQADLAASSSAEGNAQAFGQLEELLALVDVKAGGSANTQAQTRQAGAAAAVNANANLSTEAAVALQKRAETLAALATSYAIETAMEAGEFADAHIEAVIEARNKLVADVRASSSSEDIASAKADFEGDVHAELAAGLEVSEEAIVNAQAQLSSIADDVLSVVFSTVGGAEAIAKAYSSFYVQAEAAAETNDFPGGEATADVLISLAGMASIN